MASLFDESLGRLQAAFSIARGGESQIQPGKLATAKLVSPSDLSAFDAIPIPLDDMNLRIGTLGLITGNIPFPIKIPANFKVQWSLRQNNGTLFREGTDFFAPNGLSSPDLSLAFPPFPTVVQEQTGTQALLSRPETFFLRADVTLSAADKTIPFPIPPLPAQGLPIPVLKLRIPSMFLLFRHKNFAAAEGSRPGFALVCVPQNSPLKEIATVINVVNTLKSAVTPLASILPAGFGNFLRGIPILANALASVPNILLVSFDKNNEILDLNKIKIIDGRGPSLTDIEPSNNASSLIFLGPGKQMDAFVKKDLDGAKLGIRTSSGIDSLLVVIKDLHTERPVSETGGSVGHHGPNYGDNIRSLKIASV